MSVTRSLLITTEKQRVLGIWGRDCIIADKFTAKLTAKLTAALFTAAVGLRQPSKQAHHSVVA